MSEQPLAEIAQTGVVEAGIVQRQMQSRLPVHSHHHLRGGLPVGQVLHELEERHQRQQRGRECCPPGGLVQVSKLRVVQQVGQVVPDDPIAVARRQDPLPHRRDVGGDLRQVAPVQGHELAPSQNALGRCHRSLPYSIPHPPKNQQNRPARPVAPHPLRAPGETKTTWPWKCARCSMPAGAYGILLPKESSAPALRRLSPGISMSEGRAVPGLTSWSGYRRGTQSEQSWRQDSWCAQPLDGQIYFAIRQYLRQL